MKPRDYLFLKKHRRRHPADVVDQQRPTRVALPAMEPFGQGTRAVCVERRPSVLLGRGLRRGRHRCWAPGALAQRARGGGQGRSASARRCRPGCLREPSPRGSTRPGACGRCARAGLRGGCESAEALRGPSPALLGRCRRRSAGRRRPRSSARTTRDSGRCAVRFLPRPVGAGDGCDPEQPVVEPWPGAGADGATEPVAVVGDQRHCTSVVPLPARPAPLKVEFASVGTEHLRHAVEQGPNLRVPVAPCAGPPHRRT